MAPILTFSISLIALLSFFLFRHWEEKRGSRIAHSLRMQLDAWFLTLVRRLEREIPRVGARARNHIESHLSLVLSRAKVELLQFLERKLVRLLNLIRGKGEIRSNGSASQYLRSVSEVKIKNGGPAPQDLNHEV